MAASGDDDGGYFGAHWDGLAEAHVGAAPPAPWPSDSGSDSADEVDLAVVSGRWGRCLRAEVTVMMRSSSRPWCGGRLVG